MASELTAILAGALGTALWVAAPAVLAAAIAAAATGALQSLTQVQDSTLGFVPRLLAVGLALWLGGQFMLDRMTRFTGELWQQL